MCEERQFPNHLVLDGGLSSELKDFHGIPLDDDPLWGCRLLATGPDILKKTHLSFLESGSDVVETCTYQADVGGFVRHLGVSSAEACDLMKKGATIAREAVQEFWQANPDVHTERCPPLVAGSVGPYGACLCDGSEYTGDYVDKVTKKELQDWHRPRIQALLDGGVDLLAIESLPAQMEAEAVLELLSREFSTARAWLSFTCKNGQETCHGEQLAEAVSITLTCPQVVAVGINCTSPAHVTSLLRSLPDAVRHQKKIVVYANSGEEWTPEKKWCGKDGMLPYSSYISEWLDNGAQWIGGCCRINHNDLADIRATMITKLGKRFNP